jgi:cytochrome c
LTRIKGKDSVVDYPKFMKRPRLAAMTAGRRAPGHCLLGLAAVVLALSLGAKAVVAVDDVPGDITEGRTLAGNFCARCHNVRKNGDLSPLPEAPAFQLVADAPSTTQLSLRVFLQSPHRLMPDFRLTAQERDDVISYILSLKGN